MEWFRDAVAETLELDQTEQEQHITDGGLQTLVAEHIHRLDEEIQELKDQRRPGRPPSSTEDHLRHQQEGEGKEFRAGFWVPDLRQKDVRDKLTKWSGDWAGLNTLKFVRVVKDGAIRDSTFPPKGMS